MKWTVSLATVTLSTLVQTASIKTFATTELATKEECVLMALIPTPVSAMLAILVLIVKTLMNWRGRAAVEMVSVWMRSTLTHVTVILAILVLIVRLTLMIVLIGTAVEMVCVWMVSTRSVVSVCLASLERGATLQVL